MSSKQRLLELNARLAQNLTDKGVEATADETTTALVNKVADIQTDGADSYYDTFWDGTQQNGQRTDYEYWARNKTFTADNFYPKYDIKPVKATSMFHHSSLNIDLEQRMLECGIVLDFSKTTSGLDVFQHSGFTVLPVIDCSSSKILQGWFYGSYNLHTIRLIKVHSGITTYYNAFSVCNLLKEVRFEGEIAANINFSSCSQLSMESVDSIIDALVDLTGQTARTLTLHATVKGNLTTDQIAQITNKNWTLA